MSDLFRQYVLHGWKLCAIAEGSKGPRYPHWNTQPVDDPDVAATFDRMGLLHGLSGTCVLDVDALTSARGWLAARGVDVDALIRAPTAVRIESGRPERTKLLYKLAQPLRTIKPKGSGLELRCATVAGKSVQDVLPPSIHPDTKRPYQWAYGEPLIGEWRNPPSIPTNLLAIWRDAVATETPSPDSAPALQPQSTILRRLQRVIARKDPNCDHDTWLDIGMRLHHESAASMEGLQIWDEWSREATATSANGQPKYLGIAHLKARWLSFKSEPGKAVVTGGKLLAEDIADAEEFPIADATDRKSRAPVLNPITAAIGADVLRTAPPAPEFLIPQLLPLEIGGLFGAGGLAKTTLMLRLAMHVILGRSLWGFPISRAGGVLVLSAEDGTERMRHRLYHIGQSLDLTDDEMKRIGTGLYIEDLTGCNARLIEADQRGNLTQTNFAEEIIHKYRDIGIVLVIVDPTVYFGPGERFVNDGEAAVAQVAARLRRNMGCAVALIHHVGKANAREGASDQYVGRGGSALSDGLRWVWTLVIHTKDTSEFKAPAAIPTVAIREGRVLRLHIAKLTDAPRLGEPIWLIRDGFSFDRVLPQLDTSEDRRKADLHRMCAFLREQLKEGIHFSARSLEDEAKRLGMGRNELRSLVSEALQRGLLTRRDLPDTEQHGGLKQFLDPGEGPADDPEVSLDGEK